MSNLIKAYKISYDENFKTLDMNERAEKIEKDFLSSPEGRRRLGGDGGFTPLSFSEAELPASGEDAEEETAESAGFVAGIMPAANFDGQQEVIDANAGKIAEQEKRLQEISEQSDEILNRARAEAENIFRKAEAEGEARKQEIFEQARLEGLAAGQQEARAELEIKRRELEEYESRLTEDYEKQVSSIEPAFVEILIKYVKKLTGILCEDRREIITYLVDNAIRRQEPGKNYIVRVSTSDYQAVEEHREEIEALTPEDAQLEIIEDKLLGRTRCMIEIDSRLFDCSLETGVEGLIEDLKMLV